MSPTTLSRVVPFYINVCFHFDSVQAKRYWCIAAAALRRSPLKVRVTPGREAAASLSSFLIVVVGSTTDTLFVGFDYAQELKADAHPFSSVDNFGAAIRNTADQVDSVLLHLLVSIPENRSKTR
ncbi:hypothetical protein QBC37DRAFT_373130 [Rhypophila decipiens]|uniref:Uncharacterized protein n=1 Tax=Rhypophila decipiens TaxID=261697 RepID=A0AAN6YE35_9PEZI|nr:hypothetical protein QBC37DRAFT_373130 [Rhypophila decipiens]